MRTTQVALALLSASCLVSAEAQEIDSLIVDGGWQEAVISVSDLDHWDRSLQVLAGWRSTYEGAVDPRQLRQWNLPRTVTAVERLYSNPGTDAQLVRLIEFDAPRQVQIRSAAQPWDTGGWFSLMVRTPDALESFRRAQALHWSAYSDPIRLQFQDSDLRIVVLRGPDGVNFGVYERISPALEGFDRMRLLSRPFNAMQTVIDAPATAQFFRDALGLQTLYENNTASPEPTVSNFGIPVNYTVQIPRRAFILEASPGPAGRVEVIEFVGFEGRNLSRRGVPPNLGILSLRFPVSDLTNRLRAIRKAGVTPSFARAVVTMAPYGEVESAAIHTPDGAMIELFQPPVPAEP